MTFQPITVHRQHFTELKQLTYYKNRGLKRAFGITRRHLNSCFAFLSVTQNVFSAHSTRHVTSNNFHSNFKNIKSHRYTPPLAFHLTHYKTKRFLFYRKTLKNWGEGVRG